MTKIMAVILVPVLAILGITASANTSQSQDAKSVAIDATKYATYSYQSVRDQQRRREVIQQRASREIHRAQVKIEQQRRAKAKARAEARAQRAQAKAATQAQAQASVSAQTYTSVSGNRKIGQQIMLARGWDMSQWPCLDSLWTRESGWSTAAYNSSSGAYGIPQALPGDKMAVAGSNWRTDPATQINWGLSYIGGRYGTPCGAWYHSQSYGWY